MTRIYLTAGGTGGHVFPALSLAEILHNHHVDVHFYTDARGERFFLDHQPVEKTVYHLSRKNSSRLGQLKYIASLFFSTLSAVKDCILKRPDCVVGFGGYPSFPLLMAARVLGIPIVLHEQNALMGKANRFFQKWAKLVCLSFEHTKFARSSAAFTGNPIRSKFLKNDVLHRNPNGFKILVVGGSQGASIFSTLIPNAIALLPHEMQQSLSILQQCRDELLLSTQENYEDIIAKVELKPFINDIEIAYQECDLLITRSGASTVSEVSHLGVAALFVPLASSVEGDQKANAEALVNAGAGWMMFESELTAASLAKLLHDLMNDRKLLENARLAAQKMGIADANQKIYNLIQQHVLRPK
jgi:UDP-N-acetylglucosamine--N-acetylmuramyl-(pentapeptide) pyrophosphoryl-undecaprenol N-acetylglucosamine transferase